MEQVELERKEREEKVAWALYRALKRRNSRAYVEEPQRRVESAIDGHFFMMAVARALIRDLEKDGLMSPARQRDKSHP